MELERVIGEWNGKTGSVLGKTKIIALSLSFVLVLIFHTTPCTITWEAIHSSDIRLELVLEGSV